MNTFETGFKLFWIVCGYKELCFYFMDTEIYTVEYYHSYLWLDKQCIFTVVHFQSLKCVVQLEKISVCMKWKHHTMESAWTIFIHLLQCI